MDKVGTGAIPQTTTSMVKFIRTGEGLLVVAFNIALLVVPIISSALTPAQAVKWAAVINGVAVVARTGLKMTALVQTDTGAALGAATAEVAGASEDVTTTAAGAPADITTTATGAADVTAAAAGAPEEAATAAPIDAGAVDDLVSDADEFASLPSVATINAT